MIIVMFIRMETSFGKSMLSGYFEYEVDIIFLLASDSRGPFLFACSR